MPRDECLRQEDRFLKSLVAADKAETDLRCCLLTHLDVAGVSDLDEYKALRDQELRAAEQRHQAYMDSVEHRRRHAA